VAYGPREVEAHEEDGTGQEDAAAAEGSNDFPKP
jgi:hypothetical protein